jgi:hypothetical protein
MMGYDLKKSLRENIESTGVILNEQDENVLGPEETENIAYEIYSKMAGDVESVDLNEIINILKSKVIGKTWDEGGCLLNKVIQYYKTQSGKASWSLGGFTTGNLIKDIKDSEEDGEAQFEDVKKRLLGVINTELAGFCKTNSTQTSQTPQTSQNDAAAKRLKEIKDTVCTAKKDEGADTYTITIGGSKGLDLDRWAKRWGVTPQEIEDARKSCDKKDTAKSGGGGGGSSRKSSYTACVAGKYVRGCKSDVVKKVQACLEMPAKYHTGNFGPITQGELQKKFPDLAQGFTDADVTKICSKTVTPVKPIQPKGETSVDDANSL